MVLLRAVVEHLLAAVFRLIRTVALLQGLGFLCALTVFFAISGRSSAPSWLTFAMTRAAVMGAVLAVGGVVLARIRPRSAGPGPGADESLRRHWVWPAAIPTLVFPVVALLLSRHLILLCQDVARALDRLGIREEFARGGSMSGPVLLPIFAALVLPLLEVLAGLSLVALPPFLLLLLITRSHRFRADCQRLVVVQATFVGASLVGADLFAGLARRLVPHVQAAGGPEATVVLDALGRGSDVLMGTAAGYTAVLAGYAVSLWVLMTVHEPRRIAREATAELLATEPALEEPATEPALEEPARPAPAPPREAFHDVLARYRARWGAVAGATRPASHAAESVMTPGSLATGAAATLALPDVRRRARMVVRLVLVAWAALLLGVGTWQLAAPRARLVDSEPTPGRSLAGPPAGIVVRPYREHDAGARRHRTTLLAGVLFLILAAVVPGRLLRR